MKLSSRSIYGIRALLELARAYGKGPLMTAEIAARNQLSASYLEQIMVQLSKANIVVSFRGKGGGFQLARVPERVTLAEIIEVLDGSLTLTACPKGNDCCGRPDTCVLREVWGEASEALHDYLHGISLAALQEQQQRKHAGAEMYWI